MGGQGSGGGCSTGHSRGRAVLLAGSNARGLTRPRTLPPFIPARCAARSTPSRGTSALCAHCVLICPPSHNHCSSAAGARQGQRHHAGQLPPHRPALRHGCAPQHELAALPRRTRSWAQTYCRRCSDVNRPAGTCIPHPSFHALTLVHPSHPLWGFRPPVVATCERGSIELPAWRSPHGHSPPSQPSSRYHHRPQWWPPASWSTAAAWRCSAPARCPRWPSTSATACRCGRA